MRVKVLNIWLKVRSSFWFIPALLVIVAIALAVVALSIDAAGRFQTRSGFNPFFGGGPDDARVVLSTIAGSVLGVAGVVFSITVVVLTLAAGQFGPRILNAFMRDRATQVALGAFVATFIYCLIILRQVQEDRLTSDVPNLAVTAAVALAILNIGVLVHFIHHISVFIQADTVISVVGRDHLAVIRKLFPLEDSETEEPEAVSRQELFNLPESFVMSEDFGYVQAIDYGELIRTARENDAVIQVKPRAGQYVNIGDPIACFLSSEPASEEVRDSVRGAFIVGDRRTDEQDPALGFEQLVEISVRALSPSINDPLTAMRCADRIGSHLIDLTRREMPGPWRFDEDGELRLEVVPDRFSRMMDVSFDLIRDHGSNNAAMMLHLMKVLHRIAAATQTSEQRESVAEHAGRVMDRSRISIPDPADRKAIEQAHTELIAELNSATG